MKLSIVLPTYNERENIGRLIEKIMTIFKKNNFDGLIIVVDDNSPDGTDKIVENCIKKYNNIKLIEREKKLGLGTAYVRGFKEAIKYSDLIIEMDSDFSHNPNDIPRLINTINHVDVVVGSRYVKNGKIIGWPFFRKIQSRFANFLARFFLRIDIKDTVSGFRVYKSEVLKSLDLDSIISKGFSFQVEILYKIKKLGFRVKEIPIVFVNRKKGKSTFSLKIIIEFIYVILKLSFG